MCESGLSRWTVETITFYITYRWSKVFSVCRLYSVYNENLVTRKCEEIMWHCSRTRVPPPVCIDLKKKGKERKNDNRKEKRFFRYELSSAKRVRHSRTALVSWSMRFRLLKRILMDEERRMNGMFAPDSISMTTYVGINNKSWNRMYVIFTRQIDLNAKRKRRVIEHGVHAIT